jgi:hypothetical protein
MMPYYFDNTTKAGTIGGTFLSIFFNIDNEDLVKTGILAAIGALVSFSVTLFLKFLIKRIKK